MSCVAKAVLKYKSRYKKVWCDEGGVMSNVSSEGPEPERSVSVK